MNEIIDQIAKKELGLDTLKARNSDRLDFVELAVWDIECALEKAYKAGMAAVKE